MAIKKILVPVDFSRVSEVCVNHAYTIATKLGAELHLLHLVNKETEIEEGQKRLEAFSEERRTIEGNEIAFHHSVQTGDILKSIGEQATELGAIMVVMGTHGLQGFEYIVGTHAVRIVGTADVPFIIVQEKKISKEGYKNIIVPLELEAESKQKLSLVAKMAKTFGSKVHLVIPYESDEFLLNAQTRNLKHAEGFFNQEGVECTSTMASKENDDLDEAVFQLIEEKQGDLIAIMNWHENRLIGGIGSDDTQDIIINKAMVPDLVINPKIIGDFDLFGVNA